ncbi:DNA replication/repair protein RecF [Desulfitobacterium metallireducens]|uniref:DNA replication and repair protein RecF n=1 Tax=Desulfitobacterium metallireducens DSM 15288 TaxID=871968 RepID=W0E4B8_9FIRM|nr:DNA replication/repair protein RecF [Desulfitobacterium metallireducens]AHF05670.1 DNA replication protein RecF [Desulfitobacterium metallireducens DSM 15288]
MEIAKLYLQNFRNYKNEKIQFSSGINVLQGQNGQGKTNILEAIYYLLTGKSYRVRKEQELIFWGENAFHIFGDFLAYERRLSLESHYLDKRKIVKINHVPCKKLSDFVGTINVVFFSPDDLIMVKGGPAERRRFLDLHITQLNSRHVHLLNDYNKVLHQKAALLKSSIQTSKVSNIEIWNEQLLDLGSKIIRNRWRFTQIIAKKSKEIYYQLSSGEEELSINYLALGHQDVEEALHEFPILLEEKMKQEIERQMILVGPHRDDLNFQLNGKSARIYASQGQQRSIVLSLKLAELEVIYQEKGEYPLLLLDDVLSELDIFRREYLLEFIQPIRQALITMTSAEKPSTEIASLFQVDKGHIGRIN